MLYFDGFKIVCIFDKRKTKSTMKTENKPYKVIQLVKFGMLFGYAVKNTSTGQVIAEYDETEKHKADSKAELKNALASL